MKILCGFIPIAIGTRSEYIERFQLMRLSPDFLRKVRAFLILGICERWILLVFTPVGFFVIFSSVATIYILYSAEINQFYIGSCLDLRKRLDQHLNKSFEIAHTKRANDWITFYSREDLAYEIARKIEAHIKKMKSKKYIQNLRKHPEIMDRLIQKYSAGSSR